MTEPRMSAADYAVYQPYVEEIQALITQHIRRGVQPQVLSDAWRIGMASVLWEVIRVNRLLPDQIDDYLQRVCTALVEETHGFIRSWDEREPRS